MILKTISTSVLAACALTALLQAGCCGGPGGYHIGTKSLFGRDVETVYVPMFDCDVIGRDLSERLTEAVCKRIEARSPYKVVGRSTADSILEGRIVDRKQYAGIVNGFSDPRQKISNLSVQIRWTDRRDRSLRQFDDIPWKPGTSDMDAMAYMVPEYGQSELTMTQQQIDLVADKIVGMMEAPW